MAALGSGRKHVVDTLFIIMLFVVFTICSLFVVVSGVGVYKNIVKSMKVNTENRTSINYVINKIRQNDRAGALSSGDVEGRPAIVMTEQFGDYTLCTYIFFHDGYVQELTRSAAIPPELKAGSRLFAAGDFTFQMESAAGEHSRMIRLCYTDSQSQKTELLFGLKCN
ncbi:MAG: DUF4860 domain-containing protein [Oscillospiraceae bacterium]|nr:DUF4860 domain-containing protein [Oscillospiraceae bacterium]